MADTPARREAEEIETLEIEWRGETFSLAASVDDWDIDALEAFEDGKAVAWARAALGTAQYARFKRNGGKVRDLREFMDRVAETLGFDSAGG